jgi:hypothetical protein
MGHQLKLPATGSVIAVLIYWLGQPGSSQYDFTSRNSFLHIGSRKSYCKNDNWNGYCKKASFES